MKKLFIVVFVCLTGHIYNIEASNYSQKVKSNSEQDSLALKLKKQIKSWNNIDCNFSSIRRLIENAPENYTKELKPLLNQVLYYYYAIDSNYVNSDKLYRLKYQLQDSIETIALKRLDKINSTKVIGIKACVYITNTSDLVKSDTVKPKFEYLLCVNLFHDYNSYRKAATTEDYKDLDNKTLKNIYTVRDSLLITFKTDTTNISVKLGTWVTKYHERFKSNLNTTVETDFWYLLHIWGERSQLYPEKNDVKLLKSIERNNFIVYDDSNDMRIDRKRLSQLIIELELALKDK